MIRPSMRHCSCSLAVAAILLLGFRIVAAQQDEPGNANRQGSAAAGSNASAPAQETPPIPVFSGSVRDARFELGGLIHVRVRGIADATNAGQKLPRDLVLYLNGRPLKGLEASIDSNNDVVRFALRRTDSTRVAWSALLGKPTTTPSRTVTVAVGDDRMPFRTDPQDRGVRTAVLQVYDPNRMAIFAIVVLLALGVIWWQAITKGGLRDQHPINDDQHERPYSLAKLQGLIWFSLILGAFVWIFGITGEFNGSITPQAIVLLGIGAVTTLAGGAIGSSKTLDAHTRLNELKHECQGLTALSEPVDYKQDADSKKSRAEANAQLETKQQQMVQLERLVAGPKTETFLQDLLHDDGGITLHRLQMLTWTVVLGLVFIFQVYRDLAMPAFDTALLSLIGISAGTYLGFKVPEKQSGPKTEKPATPTGTAVATPVKVVQDSEGKVAVAAGAAAGEAEPGK
jgi:hypothetical protein